MSATVPPCPPTLLLGFNRPERIRRVFDRVRDAKPPRLYFCVDGPRDNRSEDRPAVEAVRSIAAEVDWRCELHKLFHDRNLGCRKCLGEAISWFFEQEQSGIILEDDCVAEPSFFPFCAEMLTRYAESTKVGMVSGSNLYGFQTDKQSSYHFSRHGGIWGWASWARAWKYFDPTLERYQQELPQVLDRLALTGAYGRLFRQYLRQATSGESSSWAVCWDLARYAGGLLTVRPRVNLVANVGCGDGSTHTLVRDLKSRLFYERTVPIDFPLRHPVDIVSDDRADRALERRETSLLWRCLVRLDIYRIRIARALSRSAG